MNNPTNPANGVNESKTAIKNWIKKIIHADKVWLTAAVLSLLCGLFIPSGAAGMLMLFVAKEYMRMAIA